jgi:hypothetical protein
MFVGLGVSDFWGRKIAISHMKAKSSITLCLVLPRLHVIAQNISELRFRKRAYSEVYAFRDLSYKYFRYIRAAQNYNIFKMSFQCELTLHESAQI